MNAALALAYADAAPLRYAVAMIRVTDAIRLAESELEFRYVTASGPGGQNVNRVAAAAHLRFDAANSPSLPDAVKRRLRSVAGRRLASDGTIVIKAQRYRSQERNRDDAVERLVSLLRRSAEPPAPLLFQPTRPPQAAEERRLEEKRRRGGAKKARSPIPDDEDEA